MQQIKVNDFSAGWIPSDDKFSGRKNGLLRMEGVCLDENGALVMGQGTKKIDFQYPSPAHTLFSRLVCGERRIYAALEDGSVYRNEDIIVNPGSGSLARAAFGLFGDFVLISSGNSKIKDICDFGISELGLEPPDDSLDVTPIVVELDSAPVGTLTNFLESIGSSGSTSSTATELTLTTGTYTGLDAAEQAANVVDFPKNLAGEDADVFEFEMKIDDVSKLVVRTPGASGGVQIRFGNSAMNAAHVVIMGAADLAAVLTSGLYHTFRIRRSEFQDAGLDTSNWTNIERVDITVYSDLTVAAAVFTFKNFKFYSASGGQLDGKYTWVQVNVYRQGAFVSKSPAGPVSIEYDIVNGKAILTPQDPTLIAPTANEVWFYRRGGTLTDYYRVGTMLVSALGTFEDNMSDADALAIGERLDDASTIVSSIDDAILEIVGPVHGRMLYFTAEELFFSDIGNPDTYNPARTQSTVNSEAEKFLWARKVSENVVLIGTSYDVYTLTGSWVTYPDGVIDVELRPLGLDVPPVCRDVAVYKSNVAYMSRIGWTLMALSNDYTSLVRSSLTLLHDNEEERYEYGGVPKVVLNDGWRYPIALSKERLYCAVPTITDTTSEETKEDSTTWERRLEIYDLFQKYWRPFNYCPSVMEVEEDGTILGFFEHDNRIQVVNYPHSKRLNFA